MPPPAMDIRMIKDVLRLKLHGGLSHEAIARSLSISKGVVAKYVSLAGCRRLTWDDHAGLSRPNSNAGCLVGTPTRPGSSSPTSAGCTWSFAARA